MDVAVSAARGWYPVIFGVLGLFVVSAGQERTLTSAMRHRAQLEEGSAGRRSTPEALFFVPNHGQTSEAARFVLAGRNRSAYFRRDGITVALSTLRSERPSAFRAASTAGILSALPATFRNSEMSTSTVSLDFVGGAETEPLGMRTAATRMSYWGNGRSLGGLPTYQEVRYPQVWPGTDLVYAAGNSRLKYEARLAPGADPTLVAFRVRGAERVSVNEKGDLRIETPSGTLEDAAPVAYQQIGNKHHEVACLYTLTEEPGGACRVGFQLGAYDPQRPLVIDPATIVYSGFVGGDGPDVCRDAAVDATGSLYVVGDTSSTPASFPATPGTTLARSGPSSAFIGKLTPDGSAWEYLGFLSSDQFVSGMAVAVDGEGAAYVAGNMKGSPASFPVKVGPRLTPGGDIDGYIARITPDGSSLDYCGYVAGHGMEFVGDVAVDSARRAYVVGATYSSAASLPLVVGPSLTRAEGSDGFAARVSATGAGFEYCGLIGGSSHDDIRAVALDSGGRAVVMGITQSSTGFPVVGPLDSTYNGGAQDAFVARISGSGAQLEYCGYLGGSNLEHAGSVAVGPDHTAYLCGSTSSTAATFPVHGTLRQTLAGATDGFLARVAATGASLLYCGYFGGAKDDFLLGGNLSNDGTLWLCGSTASEEANGFPLLDGPDATYNGGIRDGFVARVRAVDGTLLSCGYLGGASDEGLQAVCALSSTEGLAGGSARGPDEAGFPLVGSRDRTLAGGSEGFALRLRFEAAPANQPDLVAAVRQATWKKRGKSFQFRWNVPVTNRGNAVAPASQTRIYFSRDAVVSVDDAVLKTQKTPRLAAGKSRAVRGTASSRLSPSPTGGWLLVRVDALEQGRERDEANNLAGRLLKRAR